MMRSSEQQTAMNSLWSFLAQGENRDVSRVQSEQVKYDPLRAFNSAKLTTALYMFFARRAAGGTGEIGRAHV